VHSKNLLKTHLCFAISTMHRGQTDAEMYYAAVQTVYGGLLVKLKVSGTTLGVNVESKITNKQKYANSW